MSSSSSIRLRANTSATDESGSHRTAALPTIKSGEEASTGQGPPLSIMSAETDIYLEESSIADTEADELVSIDSLRGIQERLAQLRGNGDETSCDYSNWIDISSSSGSDEETDVQDTVNSHKQVPESEAVKQAMKLLERNTRARATRASGMDVTTHKGRTYSRKAPNKMPVSRRSKPKLRNVHYVKSIDYASTNKDISTVAPIGTREAREAFHLSVPAIIPVDNRSQDDVSSIGIHTLKMASARRQRPATRRPMDKDVSSQLESVQEVTSELEIQSGEAIRSSGEPAEKALSFLTPRTKTEAVFVIVISFSALILVILVAVILSRK